MAFSVFSSGSLESSSRDFRSSLLFYWRAPFTARGSGPEPPPGSPFWFQHGCNGSFTSFSTAYSSAGEAWAWRASKGQGQRACWPRCTCCGCPA